jgi:steroid 5-alpha reductase family enzyme
MDARGTLLCFMVAIWSARLGTFLFLRVKRAGQDRRFNEIKKKFFRFAFTWTLGGGWVFITMAAALAAITSEQQQSLGILAYLGTLVWLVGFGIEVVADRQKTNFRKDPANAEQFITTGLWSKSRHPNYFGEIVLWFGVALIALPALSGWQLVTLISPLFVTFLLIKVSGVRMLEEGAQKRWGEDPIYQQYVASTPVLVPKLG